MPGNDIKCPNCKKFFWVVTEHNFLKCGNCGYIDENS